MGRCNVRFLSPFSLPTLLTLRPYHSPSTLLLTLTLSLTLILIPRIGLRDELTSERAARSALEESQRQLHEERRLHEEERLLQQQWDFGYVKGISPASVPAIMEAFVRLAQLTDKVMCVDGPA